MDFRDGGVRAGWWFGWGGGWLASRCLNQDLQDFDGFSGWGGVRVGGLDGVGGGWPLVV